MQKLLSLCRMALLVCLLTACNQLSKSVEPPKPKTPEELRLELKQREQDNPLSYLQKSRANQAPNKVKIKEGGIFSDPEYEIQGYLLTGSIKNTASIANFKDAVIRVDYISETSTVISSEQFTVYKVFAPNVDVDYELKTNPPADMKDFSITIINATPIN